MVSYLIGPEFAIVQMKERDAFQTIRITSVPASFPNSLTMSNSS